MKLINWTANNGLDNIFNSMDYYFEPHFKSNYRKNNILIEDIGNSYSIKLEMPGIDKKDIDITISNDILNVKVEINDNDTQSNNCISNYNYSKSLYIPDDSNIDKIKAKSLNGILSIDVPKLKKVNKNDKKIAVS